MDRPRRRRLGGLPRVATRRRRNVRVGEPDQPREQVVLLVDGGLYDNLGLSVLEPGRFPAHTDHVSGLSYVGGKQTGFSAVLGSIRWRGRGR
jgi:hypothetical protein